MPQGKRSKRFENLENRAIHKDGFIGEWIEKGLYAMGSPNDPKPSIRIENGKIVEMDGKTADQFDMIEQFIASYAISVENASEAMSKTEVEIARDPSVSAFLKD